MTPRLGKLIVNTYVSPVITYACHVWGYLDAYHIKSLQSVLVRELKVAYKVPRMLSSHALRIGMCVRSNDDTLRRLPRRIYSRVALVTRNPLIVGLLRSSKAR